MRRARRGAALKLFFCFFDCSSSEIFDFLRVAFFFLPFSARTDSVTQKTRFAPKTSHFFVVFVVKARAGSASWCVTLIGLISPRCLFYFFLLCPLSDFERKKTFSLQRPHTFFPFFRQKLLACIFLIYLTKAEVVEGKKRPARFFQMAGGRGKKKNKRVGGNFRKEKKKVEKKRSRLGICFFEVEGGRKKKGNAAAALVVSLLLRARSLFCLFISTLESRQKKGRKKRVKFSSQSVFQIHSFFFTSLSLSLFFKLPNDFRSLSLSFSLLLFILAPPRARAFGNL